MRSFLPSWNEFLSTFPNEPIIYLMTQIKKINLNELSEMSYSQFSKLNGEHPFKTQVPEGYVEYPARQKKGGKVAFFNFELAREMGLIDKNHPNELNAELEKEILATFSIVIINEYDQEHQIKFPANEILTHTYMATRYLQLQHPNKIGLTSGDGRTVWNGVVKNKGITWDVSSCGTGATKLSPACNNNKKFYQTGDPSISYGCGLSELDEGLETLFFSEVLNRNGLKTERILAIIEFEKGLAINVRANLNLMRPSHFFNHLKQGNYAALKKVVDYYIEREIANKHWKNNFKNDQEKYNFLAKQVALTFSETAAKFEDEYIFCWMDWDGDNILMDGAIIDYGSIRQFGLFHDEYRFDDVERFSTTILEQRLKARYIAQCFAQIAHFLITKKKKPLANFKNHTYLTLFDKHFLECKHRNLLFKIGFQESHLNFLLTNHLPVVQQFKKAFNFFERSKANKGMHKVADGINHDAIFCMRDILRELPQLYLTRGSKITAPEFIEVIKSSYAKKNDLRLDKERFKNIESFQANYLKMTGLIEKEFKIATNQLLLEITMRSSVINKYDRVTGDSITWIVDKVKKHRPHLNAEAIFKLSQEFTSYQTLDPDQKVQRNPENKEHQKLMRDLFSIVREYREGL